MNEKFKVCIIGAGSIGALKDNQFDSPTTENIFTHAHAAYAHPDAKLVGFVDIDIEKAALAAGKWGGTFHNSISGLFSNPNKRPDIDIVIVATPTETHLDVIREIVTHKPLLIIAEKPLGKDIHDCRWIGHECSKSDIPLLVNYTRRFDTVTEHIQRLFKNKYYGKAQTCTVIYNRGLKRDGCHALDFIRWFFGDIVWGERTNQRHPIYDYGFEDPTRAHYMGFKKCPHVFMIPTDGRIFSIFEIEIIFEKAIIRWENSGLEIKKRGLDSSPYGPYKTISSNREKTTTRLNTALLRLLGNAIDHLKYGSPLGCMGEDALAVHKIIEKLNPTPKYREYNYRDM